MRLVMRPVPLNFYLVLEHSSAPQFVKFLRYATVSINRAELLFMRHYERESEFQLQQMEQIA